MQERPDERTVGGGMEGTASEEEGVPALAEDQVGPLPSGPERLED